MKKGHFSSGKSRRNHYNWFKGNENWNPSKVKKYTTEEYEKIKEAEAALKKQEQSNIA